jgi:subtilisin family serine protease
MKNLPKIATVLLIGAFLLVTALLAGQTLAKEPDEGAVDIAPSIKLQSRTFTPEPGVDPSVLSSASDEGATPQHVLVQLDAIPTDSERTALAAAGVELLGYIPDNAWLAVVSTRVDLGSPDYSLVRWAGPLLPEDKIAPALRSNGVGAWAIEPDGQVNLQLIFFEDVSASTAEQVIKRHNGQLLQSGNDASYVVRFPDAGVIEQLGTEDSVQWIDNGPTPKLPRDRAPNGGDVGDSIQNDGARERTNVNTLQATYPGALGTGTRLGVWDGGVDPTHPDFSGRLWVDPGHGDPSNDHGTHVAGTMAGDGSNSQSEGGTANQWRGIATAAQIYSYDNDNLWFESHQGAVQTNNVDLSQNSWGGFFTSATCATHNVYSLDAQKMERLVTGESYGKAISVNVAASNFRDGTSDDDTDPYPICGFSDTPPYLNYTSLSDVGSAKNIISVGATLKDTTDTMTDFSSWGPTKDGRLKPDIVAPGQDIVSTQPGGTYGPSSGTSMATPHISGITSLLIQRYRTVFSKEAYLPSTIKAVLLHTAKDLRDTFAYYTPGPDFASGYGIADALAAYEVLSTTLVLEGQLANGATDVHNFTVTSSATPVKVTIAWDDVTPELNANPKLVNNLDLELVAPDDTTIHLPWVLDPANPGNAATRGVDSMNNAEQVYVENPATGNWTIRVKGTSIPQGPQRYSLVSGLAVGAAPVASSRLRVAHTVSDAPTVDVYVDAIRAFENQAFKDVTAYTPQTAGEHLVQVVPAGVTDLSQSVFSQTLTLKEMDHTVVAMGTMTTTDAFDHHLHLYDDDNTAPASGKARVRFIHSAPGTPSVDLGVTGIVTPVIANVGYMGAGGYEIVDVGTHPLELRLAGTSDVALYIGDTRFRQAVYTVFAVGPVANLESVLSTDQLTFKVLLPAVLK